MALFWLAEQNRVGTNLRHVQYDTRTPGQGITCYIVHIASGGSCAGIKSHFENPNKTGPDGKVLPEEMQFAGAHFGIAQNGKITQFVDTSHATYGAGSSNDFAVQVENVGFNGSTLTPQQVEANGNLLAWCSQTHGVPLTLNWQCDFDADEYFDAAEIKKGWIAKTKFPPTNSGVGFHAQYGQHPSCPGPLIVMQLPDIIAWAGSIVCGDRGYSMRCATGW